MFGLQSRKLRHNRSSRSPLPLPGSPLSTCVFADLRWLRASSVCSRDLAQQRANIGNARIAGLEKSLNLTGYDYNILLTA